MDIHYRNHRLFNILTISLPLICFLLSFFINSATTSSAITASDILRNRGYTLIASTVLSTTTHSNLSGTIFAPPDFAFAFSPSRFPPAFRPPSRPSTALLLFHTLKPPPLDFLSLSPIVTPLPTLNNDLCLFFSKTPSGEILISTSSSSRSSAVKIRQPDLFVDDQLTVHGIDGVLDPSTARKCPGNEDHNSGSNSGNYDDYEPLPGKNQPKIPRIQDHGVYASYLDHAIRVLKRRGFNFVATGLAIKRSRLLSLNSVTVFAPSDRSIFLERENGFRYNFLHHVVPQRLRFESLSRQTVGFTAFQTLAVNKSLIVEAIDGEVRVNGVRVDGAEIYFNRWIVVFAIPMTLDDAAEGLLNPPKILSPPIEDQAPPEDDHAPPEDDYAPLEVHAPPVEGGDMVTDAPPVVDVGVVVDGGESSPPPVAEVEKIPPSKEVNVGVVIEGVNGLPPVSLEPIPPPPPPPTEVNVGVVINVTGTGSPPANEVTETPTQPQVESSPWVETVESDEVVARCLNVEKPIGLEGEDLYCEHPATTVRKLQEADVAGCDPSDRFCKLKEKVLAVSRPLISRTEVNIADDVFFYG